MKSFIRAKAEDDPSYAPYCLRCSSLARMTKVEDFYWVCQCGAKHDERDEVMAPVVRLLDPVRGRDLQPWGVIPLVMYCPVGHQHVDEGEWRTRPHKTHQCQVPVPCYCGKSGCQTMYVCGIEWRPSNFPTVGVAKLGEEGA